MGWRIKEEVGNENEMKDERTTESESKEGRRGRRKQHAGEGGGSDRITSFHSPASRRYTFCTRTKSYNGFPPTSPHIVHHHRHSRRPLSPLHRCGFRQSLSHTPGYPALITLMRIRARRGVQCRQLSCRVIALCVGACWGGAVYRSECIWCRVVSRSVVQW